MYSKFLTFTENDFVNVGPGAMEGLKILFAENGKLRYPAENYVVDLKMRQGEFLLPGMLEKSLTLRSIEHCLCEFRKYYNLKNRKSHGRLFRPFNLKITNAQQKLV